MSRLARANFKKYSEITNPLGSSRGSGKRQGGSGGSGSSWLDSSVSDGAIKPNEREKDHHDGASNTNPEAVGAAVPAATDNDDDEDPFGLGKIMAHDKRKETSVTAPVADKDGDLQGEEEEEDPFGLGRIMAGDVKAAGSTRGSSGSGEQSSETAARGGASKRANPEPLQNSAGHGASGPRKAQKTVPGGYFSGVFHYASSAEAGGQGERDGASAAADGANKLPFIRSNCFKGARPGYVFQKGSAGLGYYADKVFAARVKAANLEERRRRACDGDAGGVPMGKPGNAAPAPTPAAAAARERAEGSKRPPVDVPAAAQKLQALLLKPKKAAKAASLMADLMDAEMRPENAILFFRALKPLAEQPSGEAAIASGEGAARAFGLLVERGAEWLSSPADRVRAVTWGLLFGLRHEVKTDDSFQFARAVKRLRQAIEALGDATAASAAAAAGGESTISDQEEGSSLPLERKQAIILIMKEAFKSYHMAWARSSIEPAFKAAADRRKLFPEGDLRDTLDGFTDTITKRQRNPGGALAPPSRSVRAHNSTAHPTLNKRSDVIR